MHKIACTVTACVLPGMKTCPVSSGRDILFDQLGETIKLEQLVDKMMNDHLNLNFKKNYPRISI